MLDLGFEHTGRVA